MKCIRRHDKKCFPIRARVLPLILLHPLMHSNQLRGSKSGLKHNFTDLDGCLLQLQKKRHYGKSCKYADIFNGMRVSLRLNLIRALVLVPVGSSLVVLFLLVATFLI